MSSSSPVTSFNFEAKSQEPHKSDEIQVNLMQKSVVYWKWPNVVDIYCKRADAIK